MNINPVTNHCVEGYYVWNFAILASQYIIISGKTEQGHLLKWEVGELIRPMQFFLISVINAIAKYLELVESVRYSLSCLCSLSLKHEEVVIEFP